MLPNRRLVDWLAIWNRPSMIYLPVFLCALYETMMLTRLVLAPDVASPVFHQALVSRGWGSPLFLFIVLLALCLLCLRRRLPQMTLVSISLLLLFTAVFYGSGYTYLILVWMIALYACTVETGNPRSLLLSLPSACLLAVASAASATLWHRDGDFTGLLYPTVLYGALCICLGLVSRVARMRHRTEQVLSEERERNRRLTEQRDLAVNQSRIASELHDSVGHDLTAIIALSEGLGTATGQPHIDEAISMINDLAREGLADTRTAVKALQPSQTPLRDQTVPGGKAGSRDHQWDEINAILDHARQAGMTVALTETGRRPEDPDQAELTFTIVREAITNVLRHGRGVDRVVVSLDHDQDGAITITVRDNGETATTVTGEKGTGLNRLRGIILEHGGRFRSEPDSDGWVLAAYIPSGRQSPKEGGRS